MNDRLSGDYIKPYAIFQELKELHEIKNHQVQSIERLDQIIAALYEKIMAVPENDEDVLETWTLDIQDIYWRKDVNFELLEQAYENRFGRKLIVTPIDCWIFCKTCSNKWTCNCLTRDDLEEHQTLGCFDCRRKSQFKPVPKSYPDGTDYKRMPYVEYLKSERWQEQRKPALEYARHRCQLCYSSHRLDVHHRTYERLGHELPEDLTVLCRRCHSKHHDKLASEGGQS